MSQCLTCALRAISLLLAAFPLAAADIGSGAPNDAIRNSFYTAFFRGSFRQTVNPTPPADAKSFGTGGYIQEFADLTRPNLKAALINGSTTTTASPAPTYQLTTAIYTAYTALTFATTGFPVMDAAVFLNNGSAAGEWQKYEKSTALFYWTANAAAITLRDPYYSRWTALNELAGLGAPTTAETGVTSSRGGAATLQRFQNGLLYYYSTGTLAGRLIAVQEPILTAYNDNFRETGFLGLPITDETVLADGSRQQSFEGGTLVYKPGQPPTILPRIVRVVINGLDPQRLTVGQKVILSTQSETVLSQYVSDRPVVFSTSNGAVATVKGIGSSVEITAVGGGTARLTASSEGVVSLPLTILVQPVCCALGEGAGTTVAEAMQAAVSRNRLSLKLPIAAPARPAAAGWTQEAFSADGKIRYVFAKANASANAYVLTGDLLAAWEKAGSALGSLGYPASDITAGGRQSFTGGTLAGAPPQVVAGSILSRWALLDYETGALGPPLAPAAGFLTFNATSGTAQVFKNGLITAAGARSASVTGRIYAKYVSLGGTGGKLGAPVGEEFLDGLRRRQIFEGGSLSYTSQEADVRLDETARRPQITATPAVVSPGSRLRLSLGGFADGAQVRVSFPGSTAAPFVVTVPTGAYVWEINIAPAAKAETVNLLAVDTARPAAQATGQYTVFTATASQLTKLSGDSQTGAPGAVLPQLLRVAVTDSSGAPLARQPVRWEASSGSQILNAVALTNDAGEATAQLRLLAAEGVGLATAAAGAQVVTFSARSAARSLSGFPRFSQGDGGPLVAALASVLRYGQQAGDWTAPQGAADVSVLNAFLKAYCIPNAAGAPLCDGFTDSARGSYPNLWRLAAFVGGNLDISVEAADMARLRDWAAADEPVVVALTLDSAPAVHFVVVTGVTGSGQVAIQDPNPVYGRATLDEYLAGFRDSTGATVRGTLAAAFRLVPAPSPSGGFVGQSAGNFTLRSADGPCRAPLAWPGLTQVVCDGTSDRYQLDVPAGGKAVVTSLGNPGDRTEAGTSTAAAYAVVKPLLTWLPQPQQLSFGADQVVNGASFVAGISPGANFTIFGTGLTGAAVEFGGQTAPVIYADAFQLNGVVPTTLIPGLYPIRVRNGLGDQTQTLEVQATSPAIFILGSRGAAIVNPDGAINQPATPARRGQTLVLYGTGLGATERRGGLDWAVLPVSIVVGDRVIPPAYAGRTPGSPGVYQVNFILPSDLSPGLQLPLRLRQGSFETPPVAVTVQ